MMNSSTIVRIGEISKRFDQKNFTLYLRSEQLLHVIHAAANSGPGCILNENLDDVTLHFGDDFDYPRLSNQLSMLNHLSILHVHKTFTDELVLNSIATEFACRNEKRRNKFGCIKI